MRISSSVPLTAQTPVAPLPTVSSIDNTGGFIISYFSPPSTILIDLNSP